MVEFLEFILSIHNVTKSLFSKAGKIFSSKPQMLKKHSQMIVDNGAQEIINSLEATACNAKATIGLQNSLNQFEKMKQKLEARLRILNLKLNECTHCDQRFGEEGIEMIMDCASNEENVEKINKMLDRLDAGEDIWTSDIVSVFNSPKGFNSAFSKVPDESVNNTLKGVDLNSKNIVTNVNVSGKVNNRIEKEILTAVSKNPEVIQLEEKMRQMGYKANFADNLETAKIIVRAYENLFEKGISMPNEVMLMVPNKKGILGYRPFSTKETRFQTPIIFSKDLAIEKKVNKCFLPGIKYNATDTPESIVYHEIGHFLHEDTKISPEEAYKIWKKVVDDGLEFQLAQEVGYYAMTGDKFCMGNEFIAEVFAGLMDGKQYSEKVMNIYNALGGPKI